MATNPDAVGFVLSALHGLDVTSRYVFNGDCLYCDGKPVGWVGEDVVLLKNTGHPIAGTQGMRQQAPSCERHPSYVVPFDQVHTDAFRSAVQATADAMPMSEVRLQAGRG